VDCADLFQVLLHNSLKERLFPLCVVKEGGFPSWSLTAERLVSSIAVTHWIECMLIVLWPTVLQETICYSYSIMQSFYSWKFHRRHSCIQFHDFPHLNINDHRSPNFISKTGYIQHHVYTALFISPVWKHSWLRLAFSWGGQWTL